MSTPDFDKKQDEQDGMFDFLDEEAANNPAPKKGRRSRKELVMPIIREPVPVSESGPARVTPLSDDGISMLNDTQANAASNRKASVAVTSNVSDSSNDYDTDSETHSESDFEFLNGRVSEPRQTSATEFDSDWNEGLHQDDDYADTSSRKKWVWPLLGLGLLGLGGLASMLFIQQKSDANRSPVVTTSNAAINDEATDAVSGLQVPADSRSLFQRFDEQLKLLEGLIADGKLNEAEQAISSMDRAVYGYGAPEFSELETRLAGLKAGLFDPQVEDETVAQATQAVAAEQQTEVERIAETQSQLAAEQLAEEQLAEEQRVAEAARVAEEQRQAELARVAEQERVAAEAARVAEEQRQAELARVAEQERVAAEAARIAEEQRQAEAARVAEQERVAAEAARVAEERRQAELARVAEQERQAAEAARVARVEQERRQAEDAARLAEQQRKAEADRTAAIELAAQQRQAEQARLLEVERRAQADRFAAEALVLAQREAVDRERIEAAQRAAAQRRAEQTTAAALAAEQTRQAEQAQAAERSLALARAKAEERRAQELLAEQAETERRIAERNRLSDERARAAEFARNQAAAREAEQAQEQLVIVPKPNTISDSDFDYVTEQFHGLKTAIEQRDIATVIALTDRSGKRIHQMLQLFENNASVKARVINTSSRVADGVVVGTLKIEKLTKSSGAVVNAPSNLSSISISSKKGPAGWSAIQW